VEEHDVRELYRKWSEYAKSKDELTEQEKEIIVSLRVRVDKLDKAAEK
jgi:hypothetical protein